MNIKDQIKRSVSITDVVSSYGIDLKPAGKNYKALCPFHNEKTPSFFVKPDSDVFACYGCNKFGDIFTFVQEMENVDFKEAMTLLIDKFNIAVEKSSFVKDNVKKSTLYDINSSAMKYFYQNLQNSEEGSKALIYLRERGIKPNIISKFYLGYAKNSWTGLLEFFKKESVDLIMAEKLGLLIKNEKGEYYDRFRGRIMFPIFSEGGKVIAFGGRTIIDDKAKYVNSPESPVFSKGKNLYAFNLTKEFIRENRSSVLVEGYFDVITLFQSGIKNVTASLGTALTPEQIYLLKRYSDNIYFAYDKDEAGKKATLRGLERMFEQNVNPKIIDLGDEKDPDDFIKRNGFEKFIQKQNEAKDGFRFILSEMPDQYDFQVPEKKQKAVDNVKGFLEKFESEIVRSGYASIAADFFNVDERMFAETLKKEVVKTGKSKKINISPAEKIVLKTLLREPGYIGEIEKIFNDKLLSVLNSGHIISEIFSVFKKAGNEIDYNMINKNLFDEEKSLLRSVFLEKDEQSDGSDDEKILESSILSLFGILREKEIEELGKKIRRAERENKLDEVKKLINIKSKLVSNKYSSYKIGGDVGNP